MSKKVLVVLSGCGVYDGSEIHESVLTLLALNDNGIEYQCAAPNLEQHHVINHLNGEEMSEARNILVESARIARGDIRELATVDVNEYAGVVLPGGFGAAKNLTKWAFEGPNGEIDLSVKKVLVEARKADLPIVAFCMSPVVLAKAFEGERVNAELTVGTDQEPSPYEINAISEGMNSIGSVSKKATVQEIIIDTENKLITSPCYMMEASISQINTGIRKAIEAFSSML
ncbi:MAG: isoprenoid biosynthesis protein ElbB [Crocinitomicaceae bacterium]|nr:isoprenoid biosynthesis protein ElbB [Crocinitomicaceae bacterium]|tara:strand:+ start:11157 stop:11843 length:687 start_codon:yes stop_codon:yes gene_type:complete